MVQLQAVGFAPPIPIPNHLSNYHSRVHRCLRRSNNEQQILKAIASSPKPVQRQIALLPPSVIQHLAAGTIITSLQTATAELVENALDANSTHISVDINANRGRIIVTDNGDGISLDNGLLLAARCNATSKLRTKKQLNVGLSTLGFRGQALWALATQASRGLVVCSRVHGASHGVRVYFDHDGGVVETGPVGMDFGTVVSVDGLPWSSAGSSAARKIQECRAWILRCALLFPDISFRISSEGRTKWRSGRGGRSRKRMFAAMLKREPDEFREMTRDLPGVGKLEIVAGLPGRVEFSSRSWVVTAVNGRCVLIEGLSTAIVKAFEIRRRRYPAVFVGLNTEGGGVDWNVSPMKTHLRFYGELEQRVIRAVCVMISDLLQGVPAFEELSVDVEKESWSSSLFSSMRPKVLQNLLSALPANTEDKEPSKMVEQGNEHFCNARVVAQVLQVYILVEHAGGIMLVEQHVAEERVLYERLLEEWKTQPFTRLQIPFQLPPQATDEWQFTLTSLGFEVGTRENNLSEETPSMYFVHTVPGMLSELPEVQQRTVVSRLCRQATTIEQAAAQLSCNLATKNGTQLSNARMNEIFRAWISCKNPHTCPHGRNIAVELDTRDLSRLFGRSWNPERVLKRDVAGALSKHGFILQRSGTVAE